MGQVAPDLLCGKAHDGSDQSCQTGKYPIHGGLCSTAQHGILPLAVQAILDNIQVEARHIHHAEVVDGMEYNVEIKGIIACICLVDQLLQPHQCPPIQLCQLVIGYAVRIRVEALAVAQVAQNKPGSVPDFLVRIGQLPQNFLGDPDVGVIIRGSHPQPENVCSVLVGDLTGINAVAQGLVHGFALTVYHPAVGADILVRRTALVYHGGQ